MQGDYRPHKKTIWRHRQMPSDNGGKDQSNTAQAKKHQRLLCDPRKPTRGKEGHPQQVSEGAWLFQTFCMIPKICIFFFWQVPYMSTHLNLCFTSVFTWPRLSFLPTVCRWSLSSCPLPLELYSYPSSDNNQAPPILIHQCFNESVPLSQTRGLGRCSLLQ